MPRRISRKKMRGGAGADDGAGANADKTGADDAARGPPKE